MEDVKRVRGDSRMPAECNDASTELQRYLERASCPALQLVLSRLAGTCWSFRPATEAEPMIATKRRVQSANAHIASKQGLFVQMSNMGTGKHARLDVGGLIEAVHLVEQLHKDALHLPALPAASSATAAEQLHIAAARLQGKTG